MPARYLHTNRAESMTIGGAAALGDAVEIGLRFLDAALAGLADPGGTLTVEAIALTAALGVQSRTVTFSRDVAGVDHTIPAGARYARAWLRTYGADHVTHAGLVELTDITEAWEADRAAQAGLALKAPIDSPALTGVPTAPTAAPDAENSQIATTAFAKEAARTIAQAAVDALIDAAPEQLATLTALAEALGNDPDFAATITGQLAAKANSADVAASFAALGDLAGKDTVATNDVAERAITLASWPSGTRPPSSVAGPAKGSARCRRSAPPRPAPASGFPTWTTPRTLTSRCPARSSPR